ncbi:MAG: chitobiase/beta-hexosaminidase C-terminal domain-containing protein [Fibrobacteres bacterium]|nr:chitobiase/beta-hexosaminidase C-terminal domain-containing protein [Fibrobacterota bacterium]
MKRTIAFLILALALPTLAQSDPPSAPVADPDPATVNPFFESVSVTLTAGPSATEIRWDTGSATIPLLATEGKSYDGSPIVIHSTTVLRTAAYYPSDPLLPMTANYSYLRDAKPSIAFTSPTTGQSFHVGQTIHIAANASDADGPTPLTVRFSYRVSGGTAWTDSTPVKGTSTSYVTDWITDGTSPTGTVQLRAIATDPKGAADTSTMSITIAANKAPTVTMTSPANNSSYLAPASIKLTASPADADGNVTKVEFYKAAAAPGTWTLLGAVSAAPWTLNLTGLPESTYTFHAVAYDNGTPVLTGTSASVIANVVKNNPPAVSITFPQNGKTYYAPFDTSVVATATDADGGMAKVDFYDGIALEATDSASPWTYKHNYLAGSYTLTATATDSLNASTTSAPVSFTVINNTKPTAKTGKDTAIVQPQSCQLNGSGSSDPEGTTLHYKWSGPTGVTFSNDTAANPIAQFPANGTGGFAIQLKVTDRGIPALSDSVKMTVTVWAKPIITSPLTAGAVANQNFTYTLTASGFPTPTLDAPAATRPAWLNYNATTSTLSGKPTAQGSFNVGLIAKDTAGTDSKTLVITVGDSLYKPSITSALSATAKVGTGFTYAIAARGNPSNFTYTVTGLPTGLSVSGATISGTPTASGNFTVSITVTNSLGSDQKNLALTVNQDLKITQDLPDSLPSVFDKGSANFFVQASGFPNPSYQWQFSSSSATTGFVAVGNNSNGYNINPVSTASTGWYRVIVKNGSSPDLTSKSCYLKVKPLPAPVKIIQNPTAQVAVVGDKVQFKAKATGEPLPLSYRWFKGYPSRTAITASKADDTVLTLDSVTIGMSTVYSVRATSTNFPADTNNASYYAWSDTVRLSVQLPKLAKPTASPAGGSIYSPTQVTIAPPVPAATIWYTLNGVDPVQGAPNLQYAGGAILIDSTRTLKARAYYPNVYRASDVMTEVYTMTAQNKSAKPIIGPADSVFTGTLTVTMSAPDGSDIYYTMDGSDPLASNSKYPQGGIVITGTTQVNAVAKKAGLLPSDTASKLFTLAKPKPKVLTPEFSPDGGSFSGSLSVRIVCPTPNAILHYTLDGKDPDTSSPVLAGAGLTLTKTTEVKVIGMLKDYGNSDIVTRDFHLGPGSIVASPPGDTIFKDSLRVKLTVTPADAVIHFTVDGSAPNDQSPIFPVVGLPLTTTTTLTAIAYLGSQPGNPQTFGYTLNHGPLITPIPITANNALTFKDTLTVGLQSTPGATIYYTLDGSEPAIIPANQYQKPIVLSRTTTLQAIAVENGFDNSKVLVATYTLVPEKPEMKPPGGSYPFPLIVRLSSTSHSASIYYTLDGSAPTPGTGIPYAGDTAIRIVSAATLKAVAVAGNIASEIASETYSATLISDTTLAPGHTLFLDGGYTLRNPEDQQATAKVHIGSPFSSGLVGFDAVQYTLNLSLAGAGAVPQAFPNLMFTTPPSEKRSLYKVEPSGKIFFVTSADTVTLGAGTYFMGIDTLPPTIAYAPESFDEKDSTRVGFTIHDNVSNLSYNLNRNDDSTRDVSGGFLSSDQAIAAQLKNPAGVLKPLFVQLIVTDYRQTAYFPAGDAHAMLPLAQRLSPLQGPAAWKIGARANSLYDFMAIPLDLNPPLTLDGLRALNPKAQIEATGYDGSAKKFSALAGGTPLQAGQGYWIAARSPVTSLRMDHAETSRGNGKATFTIVLHKGWNQISNPHLETLYWPFSRALDTYRSFTIKGLWGYDPALATPDYVQSDSLVPWRGYFVYNYNGDTAVPLLTRPATSIMPAPPAGKSAAAGRIQLAMGWDGRTSLRLGADAGSQDGLGTEDEEALPQRGDRFLRAMRDGRALASDWVRLDGGVVQRWRVEFGSAGDSLPSLRIADLSLPAGDEAWAFSASRKMKFPILPGAEIPASGLSRDSLIVVAGPKDKIAALDLTKEFSAIAPELDAKVTMAPDGFRLRMALPSRAHIRATAWSLRGTRLGTLTTGMLSEGTYDFAFGKDFSDRPARLDPGMYVLLVEVRGQDLSARLSRKVLISR